MDWNTFQDKTIQFQNCAKIATANTLNKQFMKDSFLFHLPDKQIKVTVTKNYHPDNTHTEKKYVDLLIIHKNTKKKIYI